MPTCTLWSFAAGAAGAPCGGGDAEWATLVFVAVARTATARRVTGIRSTGRAAVTTIPGVASTGEGFAVALVCATS